MAASAEEVVVSEDQERCTRQPAQTVVRKLKYLSSHPVIDRFTAENATRNINQRDINFNKLIFIKFIVKDMTGADTKISCPRLFL